MSAPLEKIKYSCNSCETKYSVEWDKDEQDLTPDTCPFCGQYIEEEYNDEDSREDLWD